MAFCPYKSSLSNSEGPVSMGGGGGACLVPRALLLYSARPTLLYSARPGLVSSARHALLYLARPVLLYLARPALLYSARPTRPLTTTIYTYASHTHTSSHTYTNNYQHCLKMQHPAVFYYLLDLRAVLQTCRTPRCLVQLYVQYSIIQYID